MEEAEKRFRVGLSFPGEHRDYVKDVAEHLADELGRDQVFYDKHFEAELARPDLDTYLQQIYREKCDLLVVFLCEAYKDSEWCGLEWRAIRDLIKRKQADSIMLVRPDRIDIATIPGLFSIDGCVPIDGRGADVTAQMILERLQNNEGKTIPASFAATIEPEQRNREIDWLNELLYRRFSGLDSLYIALHGEERKQRTLRTILPSELMPTTMVFKSCLNGQEGERCKTERSYHDVLQVFRELSGRRTPRLAVLGEPGAGKTFSLARIALEYAEKALRDPSAPIPIYIPLGQWTEEGQLLDSFIQKSLGNLGPCFSVLIEQQRVLLLLDALNEIPTRQRANKAAQVRQLLEDERLVSAVVTCRERDFQGDFNLPLDTLTIQPLKPGQIDEFLRKYFCRFDPDQGEVQAQALFWQMAGGEEVREAWLAWEKAGADFESFWSTKEIPRENPDVYSKTSVRDKRVWHRARFDRRSLLRLAENPYLLLMIAELFLAGGGRGLPNNRARLFANFVQHLCNRELEKWEKRQDAFPEIETVHHFLEEVAHTLQQAGGVDEQGNVQTALPRSELPSGIQEEQIQFALDANLLSEEGDQLRFPHQLLQEYFAALRLKRDIAAGNLHAEDLWPARSWWQRTGWEVVVELLAEFSASVAETKKLVAWIARANPEVAADVWRSQGEPGLGPKTLEAIARQWAPRMTDMEKEPEPPARAAIGRALARFGMDRRKGVGLRSDGLPDIDWVEIPGGPFIYQDGEQLELPTFYIARYPVTNRQFRVFIEDGGYENGAWWQGLAERIKAPREPAWDDENHPRETVSWFEAVAFTRWLSDRLGYTISLPTEQQWEKAARGTDGREYPWGNGYREGYANTIESSNLGRTSPVGIYSQVASPHDVHDLAGNVWEWCLNVWGWCLNEYRAPEENGVAGGGPRVLRGGFWFNYSGRARAAYRHYYDPDYRGYSRGFRLCCALPIK